MTVKQIFIDQFKATYYEENWFVPLKIALSDVTEEEFNRKVDANTHSVRQLSNHLIFWNERWLFRLKGQPKKPFDGDNVLTFDDESMNDSMENILKKLYEIMDNLLDELEKFDDEKLEDKVFKEAEYKDLWYEAISNIILHNACHVGQIMLIKKQLRK